MTYTKEQQLRKRLEKAEKKLRKAKQPTMKQLKNELQRITNRIVRLREPNCYTCGKYLEFKDRQAGHHFSQGAHGAAKFDFNNLHTQCVACNMHKSGNQVEYAYRLRKELGEEMYEGLYLLANSKTKWERGQLESMIAERKNILKTLE